MLGPLFRGESESERGMEKSEKANGALMEMENASI